MSFWDRVFRRDAPEKRQSFTEMALQARYDTLTGRRGIGELTATVQGCVALWAQGLSLATTDEPLLTPPVLDMAGRSLGLKGEALFLIRDRLIPVSQWDLSTRGGAPVAYRVTVPDVGGGRSETVLAGEVLHFRVGANVATPWRGTPPLHRASLTAGLLQSVEEALTDVFSNAPLGSAIVPMPETGDVDNARLAGSFRGQRGRVLLRESVNVTAAGGPAPTSDWRPSDLTPDLSKAMTAETLQAARDGIAYAFGVLPILMNNTTTGPAVREAQRHLAQWQLQPIATMMAAEATEKLGSAVSIDAMAPLHAFDTGGRARALSGVIQGLALAKESGLTDEQVTAAMKFAGVE